MGKAIKCRHDGQITSFYLIIRPDLIVAGDLYQNFLQLLKMIWEVSMEPTLSEKNGENIMQMSFNPILFLLEFLEAHVFIYYLGHLFSVKYIYIYIR